LGYATLTIPLGFAALHHTNPTLLELVSYLFLGLSFLTGYGFFAYLTTHVFFCLLNLFSSLLCVTLFVRGQKVVFKMERMMARIMERGMNLATGTPKPPNTNPIQNYRQVSQKSGKGSPHPRKLKEQKEKRPGVH